MREYPAALALCVLAAGAGTVHAGGSWRAALLLGLSAVAVLAAGLIQRRSSAIVVSGALLIAAYALGSAVSVDGIDPYAPMYGACLLIMAELGFLTLGIPVVAQRDLRAHARYARSVAGVALAGLVIGELLVIVAGLVQTGTRGLLLAGAAAAVVSVAVLTRLALALTRVTQPPEGVGSRADVAAA